MFLLTTTVRDAHWFEVYALGNVVPCIPIEDVTSVSPREEDGFVLLRQKRYVQAEAIFRSALAKDPSRYTASIGLGQSLYCRIELAFKEAMKLREKSRKQDLTNAELIRAVFLVGDCSRNADTLQSPSYNQEKGALNQWAEVQYTRLLAEEPASPVEALFLSDACSQFDWRLGRIRKYLKHAVSRFTNNAWLHFVYSGKLGQSRQFGSLVEAEDRSGELFQMEQCVKLRPNVTTFRIQLAFSYFNNNRKAEAHEELLRAKALGITTPWDKEAAESAERCHI